MRESLFEMIVGLLVVVVAGTFLYFSLNQRSSAAALGSYELHTVFRDAGGMGPGTDIILSGVKVGSISKVELDPKTLFAKVSFSIRNDVKLSKNWKAQVQVDGLMGGAHLGLSYVSGEDDDPNAVYKPGDEVENIGGVGDIMSVLRAFAPNAGQPAPGPAPSSPAPAGAN